MILRPGFKPLASLRLTRLVSECRSSETLRIDGSDRRSLAASFHVHVFIFLLIPASCSKPRLSPPRSAASPPLPLLFSGFSNTAAPPPSHTPALRVCASLKHRYSSLPLLSVCVAMRSPVNRCPLSLSRRSGAESR